MVYFPNHFNIQLTFLPYFPYLFTIQLIFLPYFPNLITIQLSFLPYLFAELILENQQTWKEENSDLKESLETIKKGYGTYEKKIVKR
jgi:hypothetical protein